MDIFSLVDTQEKIDRYAREIKTQEELEMFVKSLRSYEIISDKELSLFIEYYESKDKSVLLDYVAQEISKLSDEDKIRIMADISSPWNGLEGKEVLQLLFLAVQDKNKILDFYRHISGTYVEEIMLNHLDNSFFAEYIRKNGKNNRDLVQCLIKNGRVIDILNAMSEIDKTNFVMEYLSPRSGNIKTSDFLERVIFEIRDDFCRKALIIFIRTNRIIDVKEFQKIILQYGKISEQIEQITDEKERIKIHEQIAAELKVIDELNRKKEIQEQNNSQLDK